MANVLVNDESLKAIGNSIRGKNGKSDTYTPAEMAPAIDAIASGGMPDLNDSQAVYDAYRPKSWPPIPNCWEIVSKMTEVYGLMAINKTCEIVPPQAENWIEFDLTYQTQGTVPIQMRIKYYKDTNLLSEEEPKSDSDYGPTFKYNLTIPSEANYFVWEIKQTSGVNIDTRASVTWSQQGNNWRLLEISRHIPTTSNPNQDKTFFTLDDTNYNNSPYFFSVEDGRTQTSFIPEDVVIARIGGSSMDEYGLTLCSNIRYLYLKGSANTPLNGINDCKALWNIPEDPYTSQLIDLTYQRSITKDYFVKWFKNLPNNPNGKIKFNKNMHSNCMFFYWITEQDMKDAEAKGWTFSYLT